MYSTAAEHSSVSARHGSGRASRQRLPCENFYKRGSAPREADLRDEGFCSGYTCLTPQLPPLQALLQAALCLGGIQKLVTNFRHRLR